MTHTSKDKPKAEPKKRRQLTPKQALFVLEYLVDFNATQAAIRAGYSKKTAGSQGQRLLKNVEIARQIEKAQAGRADRLEITVDRVALEMARLAFASIAEVAEFGSSGVKLKESSDLSDDALAAVSEIIEGKEGDLRVKMHPKAMALELLGKHLGMFKENINITGGQDTELRVIFEATGKDLEADDSGEAVDDDGDGDE